MLTNDDVSLFFSLEQDNKNIDISAVVSSFIVDEITIMLFYSFIDRRFVSLENSYCIYELKYVENKLREYKLKTIYDFN